MATYDRFTDQVKIKGRKFERTIDAIFDIAHLIKWARVDVDVRVGIKYAGREIQYLTQKEATEYVHAT